MSDAQCGTNAGHNQHQVRGEASCKDCKAANAAYMRSWRRRTGRTRPQPADILQDLITELREYNTTHGGHLPDADPDLTAIIDRAEAKLKETQGE